MTATASLGPLLQIFFTDYLVAQRRLSPQTIASYRDTFRLLLQFIHRKAGIEPASLSIPDLSIDTILLFLDTLEKERKNSVSSRNRRSTHSLPHGCPSRSDECRNCHVRAGHSVEAHGHKSATIRNPRGDGRHPCGCGPNYMVWPTGPCLASHHVQHRRSGVGNVITPAGPN